MSKRRYLTVLVMFALTSCSSTPDAGSGASPPLAGAAIERHIAYLASDALEGRDAGSPGCERAEFYIRKEFIEAGLDAVEEQEFEFNAGSQLGEKSRLRFGDLEMPSGSFRPAPFSASGEGTWPAVFAGYGIEAVDLGHDDYAGIDARGKVIVVLRGSPDGDNPHGKFSGHVESRAKALKALEKGGRALVILLAGEADKQKLPEFHGEDVTRDVGLPVLAAFEREAAPALGLGLETGAILKELDGHKNLSRDLAAPISLRCDVEFLKRSTHNVLGWLKARHPEARGEVIIVGAHHDHLGRGNSSSLSRQRLGEIHNGADDNASGVAGVLELARFLKPRARELRRHILFITLGAEERGLLGSAYFKDHPLLRLPSATGGREVPLKAAAMVNMDMIGRLREERLLASGMATSSAWPDLLEKVRRDTGSRLNISGDKTEDLFGTSDHTSFYQMGMPVIFFFTGNHPQYHTPDDDLYRRLENGEMERLINIEGMERVLRYVAGFIEEVASLPEPPPFNAGVKLAPAISFRVVLRLLPDYGAGVAGMRIADVTAGGPAAEAGIKAGDIIVRFGTTPVRSVRDYMVGLGKANPGEPIEVEIERDGKKQVLKVTPLGMAPQPAK